MRDGSRGERLDVDVGAGAGVALLVPAGESGEQEEGDEGEDDGNDAERGVSLVLLGVLVSRQGNLQKVGEDDGILECCCHPDQVERVLVDVDALRESGGIVRAQESSVCVCAETKVSHADFERCLSDNVGNGGCDTGVYLCRVVVWRVIIVVEVDEEYAGDQR